MTDTFDFDDEFEDIINKNFTFSEEMHHELVAKFAPIFSEIDELRGQFESANIACSILYQALVEIYNTTDNDVIKKIALDAIESVGVNEEDD